MSSHLVGPTLVHVSLRLLAALAFVVRHLTLEAKAPVAFNALSFLLAWLTLIDLLTVRVRAELFIA